MEGDTLPKIHVVFDRCKGCGHKFGYDNDGHDQLDYLCNNQPKWIVRMDGKRWYYCNDRCVSRDFKRIRKTDTIHFTPWWSYFILIGFFGYAKTRKWTSSRWAYYRKNPRK